MLWYVVDIETGRIVYEADNYEDAFFKSNRYIALRAGKGIYSEFEVMNEEEYSLSAADSSTKGIGQRC